ncbi:MAG: cytidylate kinase-like family protein [Deltaproteobacteria bacterium]|nr:cytidylate kinase-like family protein [Deltaproteobacteria bacterium]MBW1814682.1 cytidylate kinase-like family protein [Deltaproteobacteria bacterium]MBW1847002.1 cytidylate kinase-like family protein [Deltaproteobacteria bacterium]MBW1983627.1 cytidylate kinase-like family protein [Deltaproteobacteria bacterium]MBW2178905.1 cytidylate kinase-like family protein [Deltaproteobacteria bacterium]
MAVISISRHFGSGGKTLGEMVAKKLNYTFVDNEVIQLVSIEAKVSAASIDSHEMDTRGIFKRFVSKVTSKGLRSLTPSSDEEIIEEEIYVDLLEKIIRDIADEGNAVIMGRGSQYFLKDYDDVYRILMVANREDRVKFMEKKYNLSRRDAAKAVNIDDLKRANLYRRLGKTDYDDHNPYHLVLNMSKVDMDKACELVCELVE